MKRMILLIVVAWHEIHVFILEISFFLLIKKNKKNTVSLSLSHNYRSAKINRAPTIADKQISSSWDTCQTHKFFLKYLIDFVWSDLIKHNVERLVSVFFKKELVCDQREREKEWESNQTFSHYLTVEASERRLFIYTKRDTQRVTETEKKKMSTASLCSSVQSQINGFGGGLKLQKQSLSQPSSLTFTRYGLLWFGVPFLLGISIGYCCLVEFWRLR